MMTHKKIEKDKIIFAIEQLREHIIHPNKPGYERSDIKNKINFLEEKLSSMNDDIIISIRVDKSCEMASVHIDDVLVMSGNFWDFHPGCHGIVEYGDFRGFDDLAIKIMGKLTSEGKESKIIKTPYKFE